MSFLITSKSSLFRLHCLDAGDQPTSGTKDFDLALRSLRAFLQPLRQSQEPSASQRVQVTPIKQRLHIQCGYERPGPQRTSHYMRLNH